MADVEPIEEEEIPTIIGADGNWVTTEDRIKVVCDFLSRLF